MEVVVLPNLKVVAAALEVITEAMLEYMVASEAADVAQKTVVATNATMEAATLVDTVGDEQQDYDVLNVFIIGKKKRSNF